MSFDLDALTRLAEGMATGMYVADPSPYHAELLEAAIAELREARKVVAKVAQMKLVRPDCFNGVCCPVCTGSQEYDDVEAPEDVRDAEGHLTDASWQGYENWRESRELRARDALKHDDGCAWCIAKTLRG